MSGGAGGPSDQSSPPPLTAARMTRLRAAARRGDAIAQQDLATALFVTGAPADAVEAAGWLLRAAEGGSLPAIEWMCGACTLGAPGVPVDLAASYRWAVRGGDAGSAMCQTAAGTALILGQGVVKDTAAAVGWYRRAADAGVAMAQFSLYVYHRDGVGGLRPDDPAGLAYLRAAAEGGQVKAQTELWRVLRFGVGTPADAAGANAWGLRAAEGGHAVAQADMGQRLLYGIGIATNAVLGVALLRRAVEGDNLCACVYLGAAHAAGLGGFPVDVAAARALFERAAAAEDADTAAIARQGLQNLALPHPYSNRVALPAEVAPVCGYAGCGAALDAGTLAGLCKGCRAVRYCGADCQIAGWSAHKPACKAAVRLRKAAQSAAASSLSPSSPGTSPSPALAAQQQEVEMWRRMPLDALREAAEGGTAAAQCALGVAYMGGYAGLDKDVAAGRAWLRKAADGGLLPARFHLGVAVLVLAEAPGANIAALCQEARAWLQPLAEAGDPLSQNKVYVCCEKLGVLRGGVEAFALLAEAGRWMRAAAAQGLPHAINSLGVAAWDGHPGLGVARDRVEARRLFAAADAAGLPEVQHARRPAGAPGSTRTA